MYFAGKNSATPLIFCVTFSTLMNGLPGTSCTVAGNHKRFSYKKVKLQSYIMQLSKSISH